MGRRLGHDGEVIRFFFALAFSTLALAEPPLPPDKLAGYYVVTYWLRELTVVGGGVEAVELTDRNVWFTGVAESIQPPRLPDHQALAGAAFRPHPALFTADAEWREGLDHAGGDCAAV